MKKQAYIIVTLIMLTTVVGLSTAKAQTNGTELRTNIPFEFNVGNKTMPAGEYTLRYTNPNSDLKVMQLFSSHGNASVLVRTSSITHKEPGDAKLIFNRYGEQYFLAQAWFQADRIGLQTPKSRNEKQIERELAATRVSREVVAVTAR